MVRPYMSTREPEKWRRVWEDLESSGLLLLSDAKLPSLVGLIAGEPVRGSWWAHPKGHAIFRVATILADHPDVLVTKLVSGKVTFVHRKLWPALLAVATSREPWQTRGLSSAGRALLARVTKEGLLQTTGKAARELQARLLVHSQEIHTESGAHAKCLESWQHWSQRAGFAQRRIAPERAREQLEEAMKALNTRFEAGGQLPWAKKVKGVGNPGL